MLHPLSMGGSATLPPATTIALSTLENREIAAPPGIVPAPPRLGREGTAAVDGARPIRADCPWPSAPDAYLSIQVKQGRMIRSSLTTEEMEQSAVSLQPAVAAEKRRVAAAET
jgi:hypothetical protein